MLLFKVSNKNKRKLDLEPLTNLALCVTFAPSTSRQLCGKKIKISAVNFPQKRCSAYKFDGFIIFTCFATLLRHSP
jgi:hypothetical protein